MKRQVFPKPHAFTLVEVSLSMVILSVILLVSVQVLNQTQRTWKRGVARVEQFREARMAFESITQDLRQAILNTYHAYQYNTGDTPTVPASKTQAPTRYIRQSELQFITGPATTLLGGGQSSNLVTHSMFFQARLGLSDREGYDGLSRLLCGRGFFILHSSDEAFRPQHVTDMRSRFRLWEYRPPAEQNAIYISKPGEWFQTAATGVISDADSIDKPSHSRPIAENIIALIISPEVTADDAALKSTQPWSIAPKYAYDSTELANETTDNPQGTQHMLPPRVLVTLVAIDESSARNLADRNPEGMPQLVPEGAFTQRQDYAADMASLEAALKAQQLNYRVFSSTITLRNSKWGLLR